MEVHCGWCSEGGGFDIDIVDKAFMDTCRVVIQTCAFGGGDNLHQPIGQTDATAAKVVTIGYSSFTGTTLELSFSFFILIVSVQV